MTNRKAIGILEIMKSSDELMLVEDEQEALDLAIQALEKQEPKLVKGISFTYEGSVGNCPACDVFVEDDYDSIICKCGQRLLWKEVQDDK